MEDFLTKNPFDGSTLTGVHKNAAQFFASRKDWVGKTVIDLSCGHGISTHILRKLGVDVLPYELEPEYCKLDEKPAYANVLKTLPIEDNFADVVIFQEVIEHLPNHLSPLQEIYRILKPGGELFITTPSRSSIQGRLAYLLFEAENTKYTPWCHQEGVWGGKRGWGTLFRTSVPDWHSENEYLGQDRWLQKDGSPHDGNQQNFACSLAAHLPYALDQRTEGNAAG